MMYTPHAHTGFSSHYTYFVCWVQNHWRKIHYHVDSLLYKFNGVFYLDDLLP